MDYEWKFFICNSEGVFGYTLYIIYTRESFFYSFSEIWDFSARLPIFRPVSCFSNMLHDGFRHADGFTFSFALMQKNKVTKRKNQGYVSGATAERSFWCWKKNSLRCTTLKQHFSAPPVHSSAHAPTPRPIFFLRQGASLLDLGLII